MELPICKSCGRVLKINEKNICRDCQKEQELFCVKCKVALRHGRSRYCWDCLKKIKYNRDKQYRLKKQI
jgi:predicted amidophosphoribosyltransferase